MHPTPFPASETQQIDARARQVDARAGKPHGTWRLLIAVAVISGFTALPAAAEDSEADRYADKVIAECEIEQIEQWQAPPLIDGHWQVSVTRGEDVVEGVAQWIETARGVALEHLVAGPLDSYNLIGVDAEGTYTSVWPGEGGCSLLRGRKDESGALTLEGELRRDGEPVATRIAYQEAEEEYEEEEVEPCKDPGARGCSDEWGKRCCTGSCVEGKCSQ